MPHVASALLLQIFRVRRTSSPSIVPVPDGLEVRRTIQHDPNFKLSQSTSVVSHSDGILLTAVFCLVSPVADRPGTENTWPVGGCGKSPSTLTLTRLFLLNSDVMRNWKINTVGFVSNGKYFGGYPDTFPPASVGHGLIEET